MRSKFSIPKVSVVSAMLSMIIAVVGLLFSLPAVDLRAVQVTRVAQAATEADRTLPPTPLAAQFRVCPAPRSSYKTMAATTSRSPPTAASHSAPRSPVEARIASRFSPSLPVPRRPAR